MMVFCVLLILILLAIVIVSTVLFIKLDREIKTKTKVVALEVLEFRGFRPENILVVNKHLTVALNRNHAMLAVLENLNPNNPEHYDYNVISTSFIIDIIKKGSSILLTYTKQGLETVLRVYPANKDVRKFFYNLLKEIHFKKIERKYPELDFSLVSSSDWDCEFIWAYNPLKAHFAYYKTKDNPVIYKLDLKREHFTIDTKYKYFEAPVLGIAQQLFIFEEDFLPEMYNSILKTIKMRSTVILPNKIFYDSYNNIVYLSNGTTSLQSIIIDKISEVYYRENRLSFSLHDDDKMINFMADDEIIKEFGEFITTYNLRKIAQNFDYQTDKLINATDNTKLIVDYTRNRLVYCANLNTLSKFSYIIISYENLKDAAAEKSTNKSFVRIQTLDNETIDVTCKKYEVAQYIMAQIKKIIDER